MTDNIKVKPSPHGTAVPVATDDVGGTHYPVYKAAYGADGSATLVSPTNPLPLVIYGQNDGGNTASVPVDEHGHLEVALHSPLLPFGSIHTEKLTPILQADFIYGINTDQNITNTGHLTGGTSSGSVTNQNNLTRCATGTTALSWSSLQSRKRLRYRPGQGIMSRYTARFSDPVANSILVAGIGTAESTLAFGYNGTSFGILHSTDGVREIQTLTVTTASSTAENITITLAGTAFTVAVTNSADVNKTAYEIAAGTYTGWTAKAVGATVIFLAAAAGDKTGTFSLSGASTAVGTFAETLAGVASTDTWVEQANWNVDPMDGTGPSGITLDPTKGQVYEIGVQYLGFGGVTFKIETHTAGNNPIFTTVHTIPFVNTLDTGTNLSQPNYPFLMSAYSAGSSTDVWVESASYSGFVEGEIETNGPRITHTRETSGFVGSTASTYYPLFTIRNELTFGGRPNQNVINIKSISGAHDDATPVTYFLIKDATLTGTPVFAAHSDNSCASQDIAAATCTIDSNEQLLESIPVGQNASFISEYRIGEITIQPGETLTLACRAVTGTSTYVNGTVNTREDH